MATKQSNLTTTDHRSSDQIRRDIAATRDDVDRTLDTLGDRLHPRNLLMDVLDLLRSGGNGRDTAAAAQDMAREVGRIIRRNPGPALLVGAGTAWALYNAASNGESQERGGAYYGPDGPADGKTVAQAKASEIADAGKRKLHEARESASAKASEWRDRGAAVAGDYADRARAGAGRQYARASARFERAGEENPLLVGAGFLAAGILAGIALPSTRREDEWMGETSDRLVEQAKEQGEDLLERGRRTAISAASHAVDEAKREGIGPAQLAEKARRVVERTAAEATQAARDEGVAPERLKEKAGQIAKSTGDKAREEAARHREDKAEELKSKGQERKNG